MSGLIWIHDTQMVFLKEFIEKVDFERNQQTTKKHEKFLRAPRINQIKCCGYLKKSQRDGTFEHPKQMFKLNSMKIFKILVYLDQYM